MPMEMRPILDAQATAVSLNMENLDRMRDLNEASLGGDLGLSTMIFSALFAAAQWVAQTDDPAVEKAWQGSCDHAWRAALQAIADKAKGHSNG